MTYKEKQSRAIEILRFPLAVLVVCIHTYYFNTQHINQIGGGTLASIVEDFIDLISIVLTDCAVPMFYVISGYLYFLKKQQYSFHEYLDKTKGKCLTLLLPFFCWNLIAIAAHPNLFVNATITEKILGFWSTRMEWGCLAGPWDGPLWFIRDLFVTMLFAPAIAWFIRKTGIWAIIAFLAIYLYGLNFVFPGISVISFLWFSFGAYLAILHPDFSKIFNRNNRIIIYTLFLILLIIRFLSMRHLSSAEWIRYSLLPWIIVSMTTYFSFALSIGQYTRRYSQWVHLGASSFVIFAMHSIVIGSISSAFLWLVGKQNVGNGLTFLFYILTISLTVFLCYIVHRLIARNRIASMMLEGSRKR